jgi:hypothetical protein
MNQTPAALLVLASSVFSFAATSATRTTTSQAPTVLTLAGIGIGIWGILALISAMIREREHFVDNHARLDVFDRLFVREGKTKTPAPRGREQHLEISPELQAQLNVTAEMEGRDRSEILEETLRRHLPKYSKTRVA